MYIVADIGGTKMRIAGSRDLESFTEPVIVDTPSQYEEGLSMLVGTAKTLSGERSIEGVVLGLSGVILRDTGTVHDSNIADWNMKPIVAELEAAFGARVYMENDTALVGLGEAVSGAGKGGDIVMYMTVSTGVNAVRISAERIDESWFGSETGDQYLFVGDVPVQLGDLISGTAIFEKYGVRPKDLGKESPVWEELARVTAFGVYNSIVHWSPNVVVLGGSMFNDVGISVPGVEKYLRQINKKYPQLPKIVHSGLGDVGGLYGGLARLKQLV